MIVEYMRHYVWDVHDSCALAEIQLHLIISVSRYCAVIKPMDYTVVWTNVNCTVMFIVCCMISVILQNLLFHITVVANLIQLLILAYELLCILAIFSCYFLVGMRLYLKRKNAIFVNVASGRGDVILPKRQKKLLLQSIFTSILMAVIFSTDLYGINEKSFWYPFIMFFIELFYVVAHNVLLLVCDSKLRNVVKCFGRNKTAVLVF